MLLITIIVFVVVILLFITPSYLMKSRLNVVKDLHKLLLSSDTSDYVGLCAFISDCAPDAKLRKKYRDFVNRNHPSVSIYTSLKVEDRTTRAFYFQSGDFNIRIKWLEFLIDNPYLIK